jgi:antitoxin component HigA of HigAB toxin-antitoxin module
MNKPKAKNIHRGSSFTGFLRKEGIYEEVEAAALKKVIAAALTKQMDRRGITVSALAERLGTSRAAVGRVLDEQNTSITLNTLSRAASAVGCEVRLNIVSAA